MGRYDLMLYKLVNKYGNFLCGHAHMTTPVCRKILSLAPRQKFLVTPLSATRGGVMPILLRSPLHYIVGHNRNEVYVKNLYCSNGSIKFGYPNVNNVEQRTMLNRVALFQ